MQMRLSAEIQLCLLNIAVSGNININSSCAIPSAASYFIAAGAGRAVHKRGDLPAEKI